MVEFPAPSLLVCQLQGLVPSAEGHGSYLRALPSLSYLSQWVQITLPPPLLSQAKEQKWLPTGDSL